MSTKVAARNIALVVVGASALWKTNQYVQAQAAVRQKYNLEVHPEVDDAQ